jgi:two-component system chemotaxis response regulator CheB
MIVADFLAKIPNVAVVGSAQNGKIAMQKIQTLKPDLLILDIEMPEMNGLEVLKYIRDHCLDIGAIMCSSLTFEGGEMTIKSLELGAFDFIPKPLEGNMAENKKVLQEALTPLIKAFIRRKEIREILKSGKKVKHAERVNKAVTQTIFKPNIELVDKLRGKSNVIAIGVSTGGPVALAKLLPMLPSNFGVPIMIVQHMPPIFTKALAESLNQKSSITVKEAEDRMFVKPNTAYIAPGNMQMKIEIDVFNKTMIKVTDDPHENGCRPSADYLFRSIANHYGAKATGVIMTGMGSDGFEGLKLMKQAGAYIIAQDEPSSVVYGMAKGPVEARIVDVVASLDKLADVIVRTV